VHVDGGERVAIEAEPAAQRCAASADMERYSSRVLTEDEEETLVEAHREAAGLSVGTTPASAAAAATAAAIAALIDVPALEALYVQARKREAEVDEARAATQASKDAPAHLYSVQEVSYLESTSRECCGGAPLRWHPTADAACAALKDQLDALLVREYAAVHKWLGWGAKAQEKLQRGLLFLGRAAGGAKAAVVDAAVRGLPGLAGRTPLDGAVAGKLYREAAPIGVEYHVLLNLAVQKIVRMDYLKQFYKDAYTPLAKSMQYSWQYTLMYNVMMWVEIATTALRNIHAVQQMKFVGSETARFTLARTVGVL
jgi:hypothetical protein